MPQTMSARIFKRATTDARVFLIVFVSLFTVAMAFAKEDHGGSDGSGFNLQMNGRLNSPTGNVKQKLLISEEAQQRLKATLVNHTLSIVYARSECENQSPDTCLEQLSSLDAELQPQYAQVSLEKWEPATTEITQAIERLKAAATSPLAKLLNEKADVWKQLFNASILVRLSVGKYLEQVLNNPEEKVPNSIRELHSRGLQRLEFHHQVAFVGSKIYVGHKVVDRTPPEVKAHRLIGKLPLVEIVVPDLNKIGIAVLEKIDASMIQFGQNLSK